MGPACQKSQTLNLQCCICVIIGRCGPSSPPGDLRAKTLRLEIDQNLQQDEHRLCHSFVYLYLCTRKPTPFAKLKVSKGIMRSPHMSTLWTYVLRVYTIYLQIDCVVLSRSLSLKPVYFCIFVFLYFCIFVFLCFCIFVFLYTFPTPCCVLSGSTVSPPPPIIYLHLFHPSGEDLIHLFQRFLANFHHRTTFHHQSPPFSPIFNTKS